MNHPLRFVEALRYPYAEPRRAAIVWLPGAVMFAVTAVVFFATIAGAALVYMAVGNDEKAIEWKLFELGVRLLQFILNIIVSVPLAGYLWRLLGQWREGREADPPPSWTQDFGGCVGDGFKFMLYYIPATLTSVLPIALCMAVVALFFFTGFDVISDLQAAGYAMSVVVVLICIFITLCFMFFVTPFLMAPVVLSATTRKLRDLFRLRYAWGKALQHYNAGLRATAWMIAAGVVYGAATLMLTCSCVGVLALPFTTFPYWVTLMHLTHQVFPVEESAPEEAAPA